MHTNRASWKMKQKKQKIPQKIRMVRFGQFHVEKLLSTCLVVQRQTQSLIGPLSAPYLNTLYYNNYAKLSASRRSPLSISIPLSLCICMCMHTSALQSCVILYCSIFSLLHNMKLPVYLVVCLANHG